MSEKFIQQTQEPLQCTQNALQSAKKPSQSTQVVQKSIQSPQKVLQATQKPIKQAQNSAQKPPQSKSLIEILQAQGLNPLTEQDFSDIENEWLIDGFLMKQTLIMIYASAGSGKSYFAQYLSKFLLENGRIQGVFYFDGDNSKASLKERDCEKLTRITNLYYFNPQDSSKSTLFDELLKADDLTNILIVIDSIRNFITEDFNKDFKVMKPLNKLQTLRDNGATIIFLHHQPKQRQDENNKTHKGATAFLDSVDEGYFLYSKESENSKDDSESEFIIILEPQKKRFPTKPQAFRLDTLNLSLESVEYLKYAETSKAHITLNLAKEILSTQNNLCQQDLEVCLEKEPSRILWRLLVEMPCGSCLTNMMAFFGTFLMKFRKQGAEIKRFSSS